MPFCLQRFRCGKYGSGVETRNSIISDSARRQDAPAGTLVHMAPRTPCVVILAGLPGTGKSTIAQALASQTGGIVLDKDRVRAALFPEPWVEYSQRQDDFCMEVLLETAGYLLQAARVPPFLFIDGRAFASRYQIDRIAAWSAAAGCRRKIIHTICADETARERLGAGGHPARNRTYELYLSLKARFEPIVYPKLVVDTDENVEACVSRCLSYLRTD